MNESFEPYAEIGSRLRALRASLNLTQAEMAKRHNFNRSQYNNWEQGSRRISLDHAQRLCSVYGLTLDFIYLGRVDTLSESARKLVSL